MRTRALATLAVVACALLAAAPRAVGAARAGAAGPAVPVLVYHHIARLPPQGAANPRLWVAPRRFAAQVRALRRAGYAAVTLAQVLRAWRGSGRLPRRPVVLTFDDGYADQAAAAAPVLRRAGWPGVLALQVGRVGAAGGLSAAQVRRLLGDGWELASHTRTHPDLRALDAARLRAEVAGSRDDLRARFGVAVDAFVYPYGLTSPAVRAAVRAAGYALAATVQPRLATAGGDRLRVGRIVVPRTTTARGLVRLVRRTRGPRS